MFLSWGQIERKKWEVRRQRWEKAMGQSCNCSSCRVSAPRAVWGIVVDKQPDIFYLKKRSDPNWLFGLLTFRWMDFYAIVLVHVCYINLILFSCLRFCFWLNLKFEWTFIKWVYIDRFDHAFLIMKPIRTCFVNNHDVWYMIKYSL